MHLPGSARLLTERDGVMWWEDSSFLPCTQVTFAKPFSLSMPCFALLKNGDNFSKFLVEMIIGHVCKVLNI